MKILFVTTRFFPYGSATSGVIGNLAEALFQKGCDVHIVALTRFKKDAVEEKWHDICVKKYYSPALITKEQIKKEIGQNPIRCLWGTTVKVFDKVFQTVDLKYRKYYLNKSIVKKYKKAILSELKNHYDLCIVTLMPIEAVWAAYNIDFGDTAVAIYQLDPYWNNVDIPHLYERERFELEEGIVKQSLFCMTTPIIFENNRKKNEELEKWYIKTEFPCLKQNINESIKTEDGIIHCTFLGTLYPELRPPEKLITIISLLQTTNAVFDFYGSGQHLIEQSKDYRIASSKICLHGQIASDEADKIRSNTDVLVNIDNTSTALVPSKIFEYVSTGKPIINCYFSKQSQTLLYLEQYPLCININLQNDALSAASNIDSFLKMAIGKEVPFKEILEIYEKNTPDYVANQCLEAYRDKKLRS